jgi:hypothetical protein
MRVSAAGIADPDAPPEWDLRNAKGYWSLQIGAYRGSPDRKQAAVEAVREARAAGLEAYYYHGKSISSVLIGAWPREAVKSQDQASAKAGDPHKTVMVLPQELPPGTRTDNIVTADGQPVEVVVPRVEPVDPTMIQDMKDYPTNAVNGEVIWHKVKTRDGGEISVPEPSFLVVIPHKADSADNTGG